MLSEFVILALLIEVSVKAHLASVAVGDAILPSEVNTGSVSFVVFVFELRGVVSEIF